MREPKRNRDNIATVFKMVMEKKLTPHIDAKLPDIKNPAVGVAMFREPLDSLSAEGYLQEATAERVSLTRQGLLRVDALLPRFFREQHRGIHYT